MASSWGPRRYQGKICGKEDSDEVTRPSPVPITSEKTRRFALYDFLR
jgi:hypothetical protein